MTYFILGMMTSHACRLVCVMLLIDHVTLISALPTFSDDDQLEHSQLAREQQQQQRMGGVQISPAGQLRKIVKSDSENHRMKTPALSGGSPVVRSVAKRSAGDLENDVVGSINSLPVPYNDILTYDDLIDKEETKRKWANGKNMAIWGKKRNFEDEELFGDEMKRKWKNTDNMAVWGKRKWSTGNNMAVWGKRHANDEDDEEEEEKRNWSGNKNMALWGKRNFNERDFDEETKRKWAGKDMAVWG